MIKHRSAKFFLPSGEGLDSVNMDWIGNLNILNSLFPWQHE